MKRMSCSGGFVRPFAQLLARYPAVSEASLDELRRLAREPRIDLHASHAALLHWLTVTEEPALGLKAGELVCFGEGGVLDFAMHSAHSLREACQVASRYTHVYSGALEIALEVEGEHALLRFASALPWPRVVADFTLSAWFEMHLSKQMVVTRDLEVWFACEAPADALDYARVFMPARVKFDMPCYGFAFAANQLDTPLPSADAALHALHCGYLESLSDAAFAERPQLAPRVRELIADQIRRGRPTALKAARQLKISRRTMTRRLLAEGTSFKTLCADLRQEQGLKLVADADIRLSHASLLLGFSRVQGFHRAFRRWTGMTPTEYRRVQTEKLKLTRPETVAEPASEAIRL